MDKDMAFELIRGFAHVNRFLRPQCAPFHLRKSELMALGCVCYAHGHRKKALSPSEIGEILGISRPAITAILNTLEEKELISRRDDPKDSRKVIVYITEQGREHAVRTNERLYVWYRKLQAYLGEHDSRELVRILRRLGSFEEERSAGKEA